MAIAIQDAFGSQTSPNTFNTYAFNVSATSATTILVCGMLIDIATGSTPTFTSDLDTLTTILAVAPADGTRAHYILRYKINPSTGTHTFTPSNHGFVANCEFAMVFTGVSGVGTGVNAGGSTGTSVSTTEASGADDVLFSVAMVNGGATSVTTGADQTSLINTGIDLTGGGYFCASYQLGTADDVMSYSWTTSVRNSLGTVNLIAAAASTVRPRMLSLNQAVKRSAFYSLVA